MIVQNSFLLLGSRARSSENAMVPPPNRAASPLHYLPVARSAVRAFKLGQQDLSIHKRHYWAADTSGQGTDALKRGGRPSRLLSRDLYRRSPHLSVLLW